MESIYALIIYEYIQYEIYFTITFPSVYAPYHPRSLFHHLIVIAIVSTQVFDYFWPQRSVTRLSRLLYICSENICI